MHPRAQHDSRMTGLNFSNHYYLQLTFIHALKYMVFVKALLENKKHLVFTLVLGR
jgi:hypothetical protein